MLHGDVFCDASGHAVYTFNTIAFEFNICCGRGLLEVNMSGLCFHMLQR